MTTSTQHTKPKKRPTGIYLRLTDAQADLMTRYAAKLGEPPAAVIRKQLMKMAAAALADEPLVKPSRMNQLLDVRQNIYFTRAEADLIEAHARIRGITKQAFILTALRTLLLKQPQPTQPEIEALNASTRQLYAIGTNLNQVVKRMNESKQFPDGLADAPKATKEGVTAHTQKIN